MSPRPAMKLRFWKHRKRVVVKNATITLPSGPLPDPQTLAARVARDIERRAGSGA